MRSRCGGVAGSRRPRSQIGIECASTQGAKLVCTSNLLLEFTVFVPFFNLFYVLGTVSIYDRCCGRERTYAHNCTKLDQAWKFSAL